MSGRYEFELEEPSASRCECCGGMTVRLTRFVSRDGDPFAVYYAKYASNHPGDELAMLISLGEWGESGTPERRVAFHCRVRPIEDSYGVMLADGAASPWSEVNILGRLLTRDEALKHPWKQTAFEVLDEAFVQDPSLRGFVARAHCGDSAAPLERNFGLPDDVHALRDGLEQRAKVSRHFVSLDAKRFFVRCLLDLRVEHYETWSIGVWVEVSKADYERAWAAWEDPEAYAKLRFEGVIANDVAGDLGLPIDRGAKVSVFVPNPVEPPRASGVSGSDLERLQTREWPRDAFERWALSRGLL